MSQSLEYLASEELEGRGLGTKGIDLAADYIAEQFRQMGLNVKAYNGTPFHEFKLTISTQLGPDDQNTLTLVNPEGTEEKLKLKDDYSPLALGGAGKFDAPLVFVGYGITAPKLGYDDYENIDVKDKVVIVLRHEPQQNNPHSAFNGTAESSHSAITRKISNAYEHGAAAVLLVTDEVEVKDKLDRAQKRLQRWIDELSKAHEEFGKITAPTRKQVDDYQQRVERLGKQIQEQAKGIARDFDSVPRFTRGGEGAEGRRIPVIHVRRAVIDPILKSSMGLSLSEVEKKMDTGPTPQSAELKGWKAQGQASIERVETDAKNVVAVLEGEGPRADETIVIGAHYDHLGRGQTGSLAPKSGDIHYGADDNGSGTAALLEIARQLSSRGKKLPRRIVFIAFTGEERGLLGSARYVRDPLFPLDKTIAMLNLDMVGRLKDNKLVIYGTGTAEEWDKLIDDLNEGYGFDITRHTDGYGRSDHASFYAKEIPVLHYFTGTHEDYHRPTDTADRINVEGMRRIVDFVIDTAVAVAEADERPTYREGQVSPQFRGGDRPYFGSIPDFSQDRPGYALTGVTKGGPAEKAGIKAGDIIIQLGESRIGNLEDFDSALRKFSAGDRVTVTVKRGDEEKKFEVTLEAPK